MIFQKGASFGYLSQVIDVRSQRTIYEEMLDAKKDIIQMEQEIRKLETKISQLTGEELEKAMEQYAGSRIGLKKPTVMPGKARLPAY